MREHVASESLATRACGPQIVCKTLRDGVSAFRNEYYFSAAAAPRFMSVEDSLAGKVPYCCYRRDCARALHARRPSQPARQPACVPFGASKLPLSAVPLILAYLCGDRWPERGARGYCQRVHCASQARGVAISSSLRDCGVLAAARGSCQVFTAGYTMSCSRSGQQLNRRPWCSPP